MLERLARRMARPHLDGELCDLDAAGLASFAQTRAAVDNQLATIFSGAAGVTGWAPPVDFGPGVTPAPFSVELFEFVAAPVSSIDFAPRGPAASVGRCRSDTCRAAPRHQLLAARGPGPRTR